MRDKPSLRVVCMSSHRVGAFYFSQKNTDEQNTQSFTETSSQPISQNVTATESLTPAPLRMERGVNTEIPLYVLRMICMYSPPVSRPIGVTSHTTPLSIRRGVGGEASVFSVCRRPSVGSKLCATKLRELCALCERKTSPARCLCVVSYSGCVLFLTDLHR